MTLNIEPSTAPASAMDGISLRQSGATARRHYSTRRVPSQSPISARRNGSAPEPLPPHSADLEEAVLGGCLIDPDAYLRVAELTASDFFIERHQLVWEAMQALHARATPIDYLTLSHHLEVQGSYAEIGGSIFLGGLIEKCPTASHVAEHARLLREFTKRRRLIEVAGDLAHAGYDPSSDLYAETEQSLRGLAELSGTALSTRTIHWAAEALAVEQPIEWAIEGLAADASLVLLYSDPGKGKTYAMLDLAVSFSHATPWLGMETKGGPVLLIDEESGLKRTKRRLREVLSGHEASADTPIAFVSLGQFNFRQQSDALALRALIDETGARLVIIDALVDVMAGGDENTAQDTQPVFLHLRWICDQTGAVIVLLHHSNKLGGYRGSSSMPGAVDLMLALNREKGSPLLKFTVEKARDIDDGKIFTARSNFAVGSFNLSPAEIEAPREAFSKSEAYVVRYLQAHGNSSLDDIKQHADACTPEAARRAVYNLVSRGLLGRVDQGGKGAASVYGLRRAVVV